MTFSRSRAFATIGQSYAEQGYDRTPCYSSFMEAVRRVISTDAATIQSNIGGTPTLEDGHIFQRRKYAVGGSAVLAANTGSSGNYWVEDDGVTSGPRLTTAVDGITALTQKPIIFVYSQGEQDALFVTTSLEANDVSDAMFDAIITDVRTAAGSSSLPVFVDMLGPRYSGSEFGEYLLRDAMIDMVDDNSNVFRGAEKYAAILDNTTHPTTDFGYARLGAWSGRKVATWLVDGTPEGGPSISGVVRSGNDVEFTITVPDGKTLVKPDSPDFFGLFDGDDNRIAITDFSWGGDNLTVTGETQPSFVRYPARKGGSVDIENVVRLSDPEEPIFDGEVGYPLESMKTTAV